MKTILCATDYSESSITSLKYAYELSKKLEAILRVIHIYELPLILGLEHELFYEELKQTTLKKHTVKLKKFCKKILVNNFDNQKIKFDAFEEQSVTNGIIAKAIEHNVFLIVIGMKNKSALEELFMGTTTINLIEKAPCPVLAIPTNASTKKVETFVYATDFEEEDIGAIYKLVQIASSFNATIKIVHISTTNEYKGNMQMEWFKELLSQKVNYNKLEFDLLFSDAIFETLKIYLEGENANLIALLERKKSGFLRKLFHRDLVKEMESFGHIPLLSFNEANY